MIKSLNIKNYAIIEDLNIDFNDGFNVFTGETGAGKSIIVGALSLLLKGRSDTSLIRKGANKSYIEGIFSLDDNIKKKLDEADIYYDDELIVRRTLSIDNHNTIKVNDTTVTLNFLSNLLGDIIDIHSQKDSHYLLNKKNHLLLLDSYVDDKKLNEYKLHFEEYKRAYDILNSLQNDTYNQRDYEYNLFDYNEIHDAKLKIDEEQDLKNKEKLFKDSTKYIEILNNALDLYKNDNGIKDNLNSLIKSLDLDNDEFKEIRNNLQNSLYSIDDEISKLSNVLNTFNNDDINMDEIQERLYIYSKLKRKHNKSVEELLSYENELKEKINFYLNKDKVLQEKEKEFNAIKDKCLKLAKDISKTRKNKAKELENKVIQEAKELMLENIDFKIVFNEIELSQNGIDDVEFYVSTNKGEELKPLKNVASGGEVSRLMLSLKVIFAKLANTQTIIFDEIDTGVSGKVALSIGEKIAKLSKDIQVLTITHLAPVAACANHHYFIYKIDDNNTTKTMISKLNNEEIIKELANISGSITNESIEAASQLYKLAQERCYGSK